MKPNLKIKEITKVIPPRSGRKINKYKSIYDRVLKLKVGEYLPIEFEASRKASTFRLCASSQKHIKAIQRGNIVYLSYRKK